VRVYFFLPAGCRGCRWVFTALGITAEALAAGELMLDLPDGVGSFRVHQVHALSSHKPAGSSHNPPAWPPSSSADLVVAIR